CESCHRIDPQGNAEYGVARPGFFGSDGQVVVAEFSQTLKIPHLRNLYTKVGTFGYPDGDFFFNSPFVPYYDPSHQGDQIRSFGFTHDGSKDQPQRFFNAFAVAEEGFQDFETMTAVADFLFAIDSNLAPVVGQQHTLRKQDLGNPQAWAASNARIALLHQRAEAGECELIAKTRLGPFELGLVYENGAYTTSFSGLPALSDAQVRLLALGTPVTYTCVAPGSGHRLGIDRDDDGMRDGDEQLWGQW
ncbi:MAG: hypothetical protein KC431_24520, partial [Myxococcales bacterium]|nr:hypothetical protein [Myxococcales bacterium]